MRGKCVAALLVAACCALSAQAAVIYHNDFSSAAGMLGWAYSGAAGYNNLVPFEDPNYDPITCVTLYCPGGGPTGGGYNYLWMTNPIPSSTPYNAVLLAGAPFNWTNGIATVASRTDCFSTEATGTVHPCFLRIYSGLQDPNGSWTQMCRACAYFSYSVNMGWNSADPNMVTTLPIGTPGFTGNGDPNGPVDRVYYNAATAYDPSKVINYRFDDPTWDTTLGFPRQITVDDLLV